MDILLLILPIIAIIATGFLCSHFNVVPEDVGRALITFCYYVAVPALLLDAVASEPVERLLNIGFIVSFGGAMAIVFAVVFAAARIAGKMIGAQAIIFGLMCTIANTGFVALPVLHTVLGSKGILPGAIANIVVVIAFVLALITLDRLVTGAEQERSLSADIRGVLLNPFLLSTALGILISVSGWKIPDFARTYLGLLAHAVTPCALFAIGMSIRFESLGEGVGRIAIATVMKLVVLPGVALALALLLRVDAVFAVSVTVCAAVPIAQNVFILADKFDVQKEIVAKSIPIITMVSVATLLGWLVLLARMYPGTMQVQ